MKKIRVDNYHYRIKKGRVDILLEKQEDDEKYFIPFHYVMEDERIGDRVFRCGNVEDDGDLVILVSSINDCHLNRKNKVLIPLLEILNIQFSMGDPNEKVQHCLAMFLDSNPQVETALLDKVKTALDDFLTAQAKMKYREELKRVLDGGHIVYTDATVMPPNPQLIVKEIETLAHFKIYIPKRMGYPYRTMRYYYERIDWESFGAKIIPMNDFAGE